MPIDSTSKYNSTMPPSENAPMQLENAVSASTSLVKRTQVATDHIIVMARYPEAGRTKTRLIPALGDDGAAALHTMLVKQTLATVDDFFKTHACDVEVRFVGGDETSMRQLFDLNPNSHREFLPQQGDSLGDRMSDAVANAFDEGARRVVLVGTDCPSLTAFHIANAFGAFDYCDVVLGPATDGGYYLLGMKEFHPELFCHIDWGTDQVLQKTLQNAKWISASVSQLSPLPDTDFPEDLVTCRRLGFNYSPVLPQSESGVLSVIIPTFNEESNIERLLKSFQPDPRIEIIVADGGSTDRTCEVAEQAGARIVGCGNGSGRQMNAGAALARGTAFLFLHADAELPADFDTTIWTCLSSNNAGGAFQLRIDDDRWLLRLVEMGANLRSRWRQMPYGDQGLFLRATTFFEMNGYANWPIMEDFDFVQRLRCIGTIAIADSTMKVSARRWKRIGVLKATLLNQIIIAAFKLGVSAEKLAMIYSRSGRPQV